MCLVANREFAELFDLMPFGAAVLYHMCCCHQRHTADPGGDSVDVFFARSTVRVSA